MSSFVISSGHGSKVQGANGLINEVTEARKVTAKVCQYLSQLGETVHEFHDNTSTSQNTNLNTIVNFHNNKSRDLDVSIHFNSSGATTSSDIGVEVLHYNQSSKAASLSKSISLAAGLKDRGAKVRQELFFLKKTKKPALLIEICFVNSQADVNKYKAQFDNICRAIAENLSGKKIPAPTPPTSNGGYVVGNYNKDVVVTANLNVRNGRGSEYSKIGQFANGSRVNVWYISKAKDGSLWGSCSYHGVTGYIHMGYTKPI